MTASATVRRSLRIGVISDTHGLLRPEAMAQLQGCDHIIHAGDIGDPAILDALAALAPLTAVRGNNDCDPWALALPERTVLSVAGVNIRVLHDRKQLGDGAEGMDVVISGHSHRPLVEQCGAVLFVNPGSAGPRRFRLPISVAELRLVDGAASAELIELTPRQ